MGDDTNETSETSSGTTSVPLPPPWVDRPNPYDTCCSKDMEAILFYGDQDEATRRQVRSVAAQYSHRIGPRKRKKSRLQKQTEQDPKRDRYSKKLEIAVSDGDAALSGSLQGHRTGVVNRRKTPESDVKATAQGHQDGQRTHLLRRETSGDTEPYASSSDVGSEPVHSPHTPQLGYVRNEGASLSPGSPQSGYMRLPEYTWTEYPRYAANQIGSASHNLAPTSATAANRPTIELPNPVACHGGRNNALPSPPRSTPIDMPVKPLHSDQFLHRANVDERNIPREAKFGPVSAEPRLKIMRCATDETKALNDDASRWRSGFEHVTVGGPRSEFTPG